LKFAQVDISTEPDLQYSLPPTMMVCQLSLSACRTSFLGAYSDMTIGLHKVETGQLLFRLEPPRPSVEPVKGWNPFNVGWLDQSHVWVAWKNYEDTALPYSICILDIVSEEKPVFFEKISWDGSATNWNSLMLQTRHRHLLTVNTEGKQEEQDLALDLNLPFNIQRIPGVWADSCGLICIARHIIPHMPTQRGHTLVLREFF